TQKKNSKLVKNKNQKEEKVLKDQLANRNETPQYRKKGTRSTKHAIQELNIENRRREDLETLIINKKRKYEEQKDQINEI
ncbi:42849_t:CDS:1, partial [Gigaspora margarita]